MNIINTPYNNLYVYDEKDRWKESFYKPLEKMMNEHIIPTFGQRLSMNLQVGFFTSDQYGSYRINFYDKENKKICYIIADIILGEWKAYRNEDIATKDNDIN